MAGMGTVGYDFGNFRLYPEEALLLRSGQPVPLPPKTFKMLCVLVENNGHLVDKDALIKAVWPDTHVVENNLRYNISLLRKALSDNGQSQEFIVTSPKLGYRFVGDVYKIQAGRTGHETASASITPSGDSQKLELRAADVAGQGGKVRKAASSGIVQKIALSIIVILVVAVCGFAVFYGANWKSKPSAIAPARLRTLAVLPLRNLKPGPETDFLSLALTDAIINRLEYVNELAVAPTSSVTKYRNTDIDPKQVASELKVGTVLSGSYLREDDVIRISTELINVDSNGSPLRQNLELKYDKLFSVQDRVASSVIHDMGLALEPLEIQIAQHDLPRNPIAYDYYLRATDLASLGNYQGSAKLLEKAVALEPKNAMAWTSLGESHLAYARIQGGGEVYVQQGWEELRKARALAPDNPVIRSLVALQLIENNKLDEAIVLLREQVRQNPNDSWAHWFLSEAYRYGGALPESVNEGEVSRSLNPQIPNGTTFNTYMYLGHYERFLASLSGEGARTSFYRGLAYFYLNDMTHALAEFDHAYALAPTLLHAQIGQALEDAATGRAAKGIELMRSIEKSETEDGEMVYKMAQAYAQLGDKQSSLRLLRRSIDLNFYPSAYFASDPLLVPLRDDAQYGAIIELARQRHEVFQQKYF